MSDHERDEMFMDLCGSLDEEGMTEARAGNVTVQLVSAVLKTSSGEDRLLFTYEEYGDQEHVKICEEVIDEMTPFLHANETLRVATYDVDISLAEPFDFPSEESLNANKNEGRSRYASLHEARGVTTVIVMWLVTETKRSIYTWDVDQGDGAAMYESAVFTARSLSYNKLLARGERIEIVAYDVPMKALHEVVL